MALPFWFECWDPNYTIHGEFRNAVQEQCPWTLMIINRFHVIKISPFAL